MKKSTFNQMSKMIMAMMLCILSVNFAKAQEQEFVLDAVVDVNSGNYEASFVAPSSGMFTFYAVSNPGQYAIYEADNLEVELENEMSYCSESLRGLTFGTKRVTIVEEGKKYVIKAYFWSATQVLGIISSDTIELSSVTPSENSKISIAGDAQIDVAFNCNIALESVTVVSGVQTETLPYSNAGDSKVIVYANSVSVILKDVLYNWITNELVKPGDIFTLTLNGICRSNDPSVIYGENGCLTLNFVVDEVPAQLIETVNTPDKMKTLKSFYFDDDQNGTIKLVFDKPLLNSNDDAPFAVLGIGNKEAEGDYYEERVPCVVDGSILIINLQGKLRNVATMNLSMAYYDAQFSVKNVKSNDGNYVYTEDSGKLGSFDYSYSFEYVECDIVAEFAPAKGEIEVGDEIEIWIMGEKDLRYEGVALNYDDKEVVITDFEKVVDTEDEKASIITFAIPELDGAKEGTIINLSLKNVLAADGLDHSNDVKASYTFKETVSVDAIGAEDASCDVYNLNGVKVAEGLNKSNLQNLDKGLYIINGRKVILR